MQIFGVLFYQYWNVDCKTDPYGGKKEAQRVKSNPMN